MGKWNATANEIFLQALELDSPDEVRSFLADACGTDAKLRAEVDSLLAARNQVGSFLESPATGIAATLDPAPTLDTAPVAIQEKPGMKIGRYKLIHEIGHGGMGVVYMAVQKEPVKRKVALKIIKPGMDTKEVVARFEAERQALAMMDHQSIATVLDGGSTESGRPFFVMELVEGTPIGEYCDACRYTTRQRLELFIKVCQAIQHAHLKGVIHRDIKPSNILVTNDDTVALPKVIDFGIAKAVHQPLTDASVYTNVQQMVGTPLYMSPEQAQRTAQDVDTRTDVYSLGVLLYELLTGTTPFEKERFQESGLDEVKRIIREEEPPKPSTRLRTLGETVVALDTVAENHHTDVRALTQELSGELDWIVMKALEKDRSRRYESASDFAKDVQRYLDDEPVAACPPSTAYRLGKFYRRNKVAFMMASAVALTLILGLAGTTWQAIVATEAKEREQKQAEIADEQRAAAEANYVRAREAVEQMLTRVADEELAAIPEMTEVRLQLMEDAKLFYDELLELNPDDAEAYFDRARVRQALVEPTDEIEADFKKAIELAPENAAFEQGYSFFLRYDAVDLQRALAHAQRAVELAPDNEVHIQALTLIHSKLGQHDKSLALLNDKIARSSDSAVLYAARSAVFRSMDRCGEALSDARNAVALDPELARGWVELACALQEAGDYAEALAAADRAIEIAGERRPTAWLFIVRGQLHEKLKNDSLALRDFTRAIELSPRRGAGSARQLRGKIYVRQQRWQEALSDFTRVIELSPQQEGYVRELRAAVYARQHRWQEALADFDKVVELAPSKAYILKRCAAIHFQLGEYDEAVADIAKAVERNPADLTNLTWIPLGKVATCPDEQFRTGLVELADRSIELTDEGARAYATRGWILAALGREKEAMADLKTAFDHIAEVHKSDDLDLTCYAMVKICGELAHRQEVIPYLAKMADLRPDDPIQSYRVALALLYDGQADSYRDTCRRMLEHFQNTDSASNAYRVAWTCLLGRAAVEDYAPVVRLAELAVKSESESVSFLGAFGGVLYRADQAEEAVERLTRADELIADPNKAGHSSPAYIWYFLAMAHHKLGHDADAGNWLAKANQWTDKALYEHQEGTATLSWNRRLTLKLLRDEAEGMIGLSDQPKDDTESKQDSLGSSEGGAST